MPLAVLGQEAQKLASPSKSGVAAGTGEVPEDVAEDDLPEQARLPGSGSLVSGVSGVCSAPSSPDARTLPGDGTHAASDTPAASAPALR